MNIKYAEIKIDNKAVIQNWINQTINSKSKHIDIKYHHIRELIIKGDIRPKHNRTNANLADDFIKYHINTLITKFRESILTKF